MYLFFLKRKPIDADLQRRGPGARVMIIFFKYYTNNIYLYHYLIRPAGPRCSNTIADFPYVSEYVDKCNKHGADNRIHLRVVRHTHRKDHTSRNIRVKIQDLQQDTYIHTHISSTGNINVRGSSKII